VDYKGKHFREKNNIKIHIDKINPYVDYERKEDLLDITHTIVPKDLEGRGLGSLLVKAAFQYAMENGLKRRASCSFAALWLKRHPEFDGCGMYQDDISDYSCPISRKPKS